MQVNTSGHSPFKDIGTFLHLCLHPLVQKTYKCEVLLVKEVEAERRP